MADHTHIEWTDATWNPITGCSIISPGCTNCYAMKLAGTRLKHIASRTGLTVDTKAGPVWNGQVRFNEQWIAQPLRWKRPRRIFVCAHGDLFAENVPDEWIDRVFAIMALAPQHTFQALTKRAERMRRYVSSAQMRVLGDGVDCELAAAGIQWNGDWKDRHSQAIAGATTWPLPNVWLGVSAEDQTRANERVPELLATPAAIRFVSAEPLLGPIDFGIAWHGENALDSECWGDCAWCDKGFPPLHNCQHGRQGSEWERGRSGLDWIIVGGESGKGARPMHPDWVRSIRDQCATAGVPFFFKQWGEWAPQIGAVNGWNLDDDPEISRFEHREWEDGRWSEPFWPMWCDWSDGNYDEEQCVSRIGKRRAGRMLDDVDHSAMPVVRP